MINNDLMIISVDQNLRTLTIPPDGTIFGVSGDIYIGKIGFCIPRNYCGLDLQKFRFRINYVTPNGIVNYYDSTDITIDGTNIIFVWVLNPEITAYVGNIKFSVTLYQLEEDKVVKKFNTRSATAKIVEGFEAENYVTPEEQQTLLDKLESRLIEKMDVYFNNKMNEAKNNIDAITNTSKEQIAQEGNNILQTIQNDKNVSNIKQNTDDISTLKKEVEELKQIIQNMNTE